MFFFCGIFFFFPVTETNETYKIYKENSETNESEWNKWNRPIAVLIDGQFLLFHLLRNRMKQTNNLHKIYKENSDTGWNRPETLVNAR